MLIAGSRFVSHWIYLGAPREALAYEEGSPIDRLVFAALIIWGAAILVRRRKETWRLIRANGLFCAYLAFCLASILWTEEPYVLAKRWVKELGIPIMALVLLTERNPTAAITAVLRRLSFVALPLSVLFIKYFPELGRGYTPQGGAMYTGIGSQKNDLGLMCLLAGFYYAWGYLNSPAHSRPPALANPAQAATLLLSLAWLMYMANSQTSLVCLIVIAFILSAARLPLFRSKPSAMIPALGLVALLGAAGNYLFGLRSAVLAILGRREDLTNRAQIWDITSSLAGDAWVGTGFMSFWTPERTLALKSQLGGGVNQAHNGYLEQYLNLGYIGVLFILLILCHSLWRSHRTLPVDTPAAVFTLAATACACFYNYTEASFYGVNNMWLLLVFSALSVPYASRARVDGHTAAHRVATAHQVRGERYRLTKGPKRAVDV